MVKMRVKKNKNANKTGKAKKGNPSRKQGPRAGGESEYGKLLYNPCTANLVPAPYQATGSGLLMRLRASTTIGNTAGVTSGAYLWSPGAASCCQFSAASGSTSTTAVGAGDPVQAGFISSQCSSFRTVAACIRVTSLAPATNLCGTIGLGNCMVNTILHNGSYTAEQLLSLVPNCMRLDADTKEIVWLPNTSDEEFTGISAGSSAGKGNVAAILFAYSGTPAAAGFRLDFFEIIEYYPITTLGIYPSVQPPPRGDLRDALRKFWEIHGTTIKSVGSGVIKMAAGVMLA